MKEYFVRTADGKHADVITATDGATAIQIFKSKHELKRYKNFVVCPANWIFE